MILSRAQRRILCLALADYREELVRCLNRCMYALEHMDKRDLKRTELREKYAEEIVVYKARLLCLDEVVQIIGAEVEGG